MPTRKLFYTPGCLEARAVVQSCEPAEDGLFRVVLDRTPFHPKGGGQPADKGTLGGLEVAAVLESEAGDVLHFVKGELAAGAEIEAKVDPAARRLHSRLHSAAHLFSKHLEGRGWAAVKGDHFPGQSRVVFRPADPENSPAIPEAAEIEAWLAGIASQKLPFLQTVDEKGFRQVTWGSIPPYPCGGTHVADTSGIGEIRIRKIKLKKGELSVSYDAA